MIILTKKQNKGCMKKVIIWKPRSNVPKRKYNRKGKI